MILFFLEFYIYANAKTSLHEKAAKPPIQTHSPLVTCCGGSRVDIVRYSSAMSFGYGRLKQLIDPSHTYASLQPVLGTWLTTQHQLGGISLQLLNIINKHHESYVAAALSTLVVFRIDL